MHPKRAGSGRGEAGFTLIDMLFVIALIGLLSTLAIPGLMRARGAAQSSSALGTMRVLNSAQISYAISCGLGFYSPDLPTLAKIPPGAKEGFVAPELASGPTFIKSGYSFSMAGTAVPGAPATCNGLGAGASAAGYALVADPLDTTPTGATLRYEFRWGHLRAHGPPGRNNARDGSASGRPSHQVRATEVHNGGSTLGINGGRLVSP